MSEDLKALQDQVSQLTELVKQQQQFISAMTGVGPKKPTGAQTDYVEWGSERHAAMLGIVTVANEKDLLPGDVSYRSPTTKKLFKLEDPITQFMTFARPIEVANLVLRQKVACFEAGKPVVPDDSPPLMTFGMNLLPGMSLVEEQRIQ